MPYLTDSTYRAPLWMRNAHVNTIVPATMRRVLAPAYTREMLTTPDGDFLDLDFVTQGSDRLVIALHGLEGSSDRPYIRGLLAHWYADGWDGMGFNFRSCSGRLNALLPSYHMGASHDVHTAVQYAIQKGYSQIVLVGFSLGGNVLLKYFGEQGAALPAAIKAGVAFSVPCHIASANVHIDHWQNRLYLMRFLRTLNEKMIHKARLFPDEVVLPKRMPRNFQEFDDLFTAPIHGFKDAKDYWERCSSLRFMEGIRRPVLLVNAEDDTFLSPKCFPKELAGQHDFLHLETPAHGGHCGFYPYAKAGEHYWSEQRALEFWRYVCGCY